MNTKFYLSVVALALAVMACNGKKNNQLSGGIDVSNLDKTVAPSADFYQYACGGWMKAHPLTDEYGRFGSMDLLRENNNTQMRGLIEGVASQQFETGSVGQKIGDLYKMAMDSTKLNREGVAPIQPLLDRIKAVKNNAELPALVAQMTREGLSPYFSVFVSADDMNSSMNIVQTYQGGLGLGNRDYYLAQDENNANIRAKYEEHVVKMFQLAGWEEKEAKKAAADVMKVETKLAEASYDMIKMRDPHANYHKMPIDELKKQISGIDWDIYFNTLGLRGLTELNVGQPEQLQEVAQQISKGKLDEQKSYLQWKVIDAAAAYLSDDFVVEDFEFNGKVISGTKEMKPRWKRAVATVDGAMGEAVGQMYVEKYFPAAAKERMVKLVGNLQKALGERIQKLTWMSDETKQKAQEKLDAIYVKVGYPDTWRDYSGLEIKN